MIVLELDCVYDVRELVLGIQDVLLYMGQMPLVSQTEGLIRLPIAKQALVVAAHKFLLGAAVFADETAAIHHEFC